MCILCFRGNTGVSHGYTPATSTPHDHIRIHDAPTHNTHTHRTLCPLVRRTLQPCDGPPHARTFTSARIHTPIERSPNAARLSARGRPLSRLSARSSPLLVSLPLVTPHVFVKKPQPSAPLGARTIMSTLRAGRHTTHPVDARHHSFPHPLFSGVGADQEHIHSPRRRTLPLPPSPHLIAPDTPSSLPLSLSFAPYTVEATLLHHCRHQAVLSAVRAHTAHNCGRPLSAAPSHTHTHLVSLHNTHAHIAQHTPSDHTNSKRLSFLPSFLLPPYLSFTPRLAFAPSRCRPRPQARSAARRAGVTRARQTRPGRAPGVSSPCRSRA